MSDRLIDKRFDKYVPGMIFWIRVNLACFVCSKKNCCMILHIRYDVYHTNSRFGSVGLCCIFVTTCIMRMVVGSVVFQNGPWVVLHVRYDVYHTRIVLGSMVFQNIGRLFGISGRGGGRSIDTTLFSCSLISVRNLVLFCDESCPGRPQPIIFFVFSLFVCRSTSVFDVSCRWLIIIFSLSSCGK